MNAQPITGSLRFPAAVIVAIGIAHLFASPVAEPFKYGDETRHVMTGVFVRDAIHDLPSSARDPKGYAVRYYVQYPALGIIIWPPFFYAVEGLAMSVFGTSYLTARLVICVFALVGAIYAYRLTLRTHGPAAAALALCVLGFAPLVFDFCGYVLLEVPTLALVLASIFHFERYLSDLRPRDALLACLLAALAALTRFDGVVLLPYVLLRLGFARKFGLLIRRPVVLGVLGALVLTVPYYWLTWRLYGGGIRHSVTTGTGPQSTDLLAWRNFLMYPSFIPEQIGWAATVAAIIGAGAALVTDRRRAAPLFAILAATYITFVPLAEPESRHAIYWVPALSVFAAVGVQVVWDRWGRRAGLAALVLVVAGTAGEGIEWTGWYVRGNKATADYVVAHAREDRPVMVEGVLNGAFIYYVRRADPQRRLWVLRGDKMLYAVHSDPHGKYVEYTRTDQEVLDVIHKFDPEFIVVEQPQLIFDLPAADRLRAVLRRYPDRFPHEHTVEFESNHHVFRTGRWEIYRKLDRNPAAVHAIEVPVLGLGTSLEAKR